MIRGILLGSVAFGTVFLLERQLGTALTDMRRYDKMRAMSGDSSVVSDGFKQIGGYLLRSARRPYNAKAGPVQKGYGALLFDTVLTDALRYVAMRTM